MVFPRKVSNNDVLFTEIQHHVTIVHSHSLFHQQLPHALPEQHRNIHVSEESIQPLEGRIQHHPTRVPLPRLCPVAEPVPPHPSLRRRNDTAASRHSTEMNLMTHSDLSPTSTLLHSETQTIRSALLPCVFIAVTIKHCNVLYCCIVVQECR